MEWCCFINFIKFSYIVINFETTVLGLFLLHVSFIFLLYSLCLSNTDCVNTFLFLDSTTSLLACSLSNSFCSALGALYCIVLFSCGNVLLIGLSLSISSCSSPVVVVVGQLF